MVDETSMQQGQWAGIIQHGNPAVPITSRPGSILCAHLFRPLRENVLGNMPTDSLVLERRHLEACSCSSAHHVRVNSAKSFAKHVKHCVKVFKTKRKAFSMNKRVGEAAAAGGWIRWNLIIQTSNRQ